MCRASAKQISTPLKRGKKSRGGLVFPLQGMIGICTAAREGVTSRKLLACPNLKYVHAKSKHLVLEVLSLPLEKKWFSHLQERILNSDDALDQPIYMLCKRVAELYISLRLHHTIKERNREMSDEEMRSALMRLITFRNQ